VGSLILKKKKEEFTENNVIIAKMVKYIITISWADLHAQKKMSFTIFDLYPFIQQIIYRSI
jgi:hypothetical protein